MVSQRLGHPLLKIWRSLQWKEVWMSGGEVGVKEEVELGLVLDEVITMRRALWMCGGDGVLDEVIIWKRAKLVLLEGEVGSKEDLQIEVVLDEAL